MKYTKTKSKNRIWIIFLLLLAIIVLVGILKLCDKQEGYRTIKVIEISGKVGVVNNGAEYEAYPGMVLSEGYSIITSTDSYVRMALDDDKYIRLEEGSKAVFDKLGVLGSGKTTISLERGAIVSEIVNPLKVNENYIVNTPNAVLAVRGTMFKVAVSIDKNGERNTDVYTFGGSVSSQRIEPNGNVIDEEVIIEAGYKAKVKMDSKETVYVAEVLDNEEKHIIPIDKQDINEQDIIDMHFASKNGHELFIDTDEIKNIIEEKQINIEEHTSVYDKAINLEGLKSVTSIDDSEVIVKEDESVNKDAFQGVLADGVHKHNGIENIVEATCENDGLITIRCSECGEIISENIISATGHTEGEVIIVKEATCSEEGMKEVCCIDCGTVLDNTTIPVIEHEYENVVIKETSCSECGVISHRCKCGYGYQEEIEVTSHREVNGGTAGSHIECADCGTILSTAHSYTDTVTKEASCTKAGELTHRCVCGYSYTEEIPITSHSYTITVTKVPSCYELGIRKYTCECGYSYTEDIPLEDHVEVAGGEAGVHKKCNVCGEIIEDGTHHYYTEEVTTAATCTTTGEKKYSCNCGHSYTEEVAALGHKKANENASVTICDRCGLDWVDISATNFEDEALRTCLAQYDTDNDGYLIGTELTGITNINLAGTVDEDGGCMSLSGIEILPNVTVIDCSYNADLTQVDFSGNTKLYQLNVSNTGVESIDVSGCIGLSTLKYSDCQQLKHLDVSDTTLTSLIINSNPALQTLNVDGTSFTNLRISGTQITSLTLSDFSRATAVTVNDTPLQTVTISNCKLGNVSLNDISQLESVIATDSTISLINVSNCTGLKTLSVSDSGASVSFENDTQLEIINLSGTSLSTSLELLGTDYTKLSSLDISNTSLNQLNVSGCTTLTTLKVEGCESLTSVNVANTDISALDLADCTSLSTINASGSSLMELNATSNYLLETIDVSDCTSLTDLWMNDTENTYALNSVNVSGCSALVDITLYGCNNLTSINVEDCTNLEIFSLEKCMGITSVDLSNNNKLTGVAVNQTGITTLDLSGKTSIEQVYAMNCANLTTVNLSNSSIAYICLAGCNAVTSINVTGITNEYNGGNAIMIHYDGQPYDNGIFINDGSVTVEQEPFT